MIDVRPSLSQMLSNLKSLSRHKTLMDEKGSETKVIRCEYYDTK